jgi:hypothetical protein
VKILRASWLRDGTWPGNAAAPSSDEAPAAPPLVTQAHAVAVAVAPNGEHSSSTPAASDLLARLR